jgi:hypothetical protein
MMRRYLLDVLSNIVDISHFVCVCEVSEIRSKDSLLAKGGPPYNMIPLCNTEAHQFRSAAIPASIVFTGGHYGAIVLAGGSPRSWHNFAVTLCLRIPDSRCISHLLACCQNHRGALRKHSRESVFTKS